MHMHPKLLTLELSVQVIRVWGAAAPRVFELELLVIKRSVLVPEVCPCICIRAMMHHVHTGEAVVTSIKIDICRQPLIMISFITD